MATNNAINQHRPSGFQAYLSASTANNKTGDGTVYNVIFDTIQTTDGNYNNATGIYTASQSGRFLIGGNVVLNNLGAGHTLAQLFITATAEEQQCCYINPVPVVVGTTFTLNGSGVFNLSAGQTVVIRLQASNSTKTVGLLGSGSPYNTYVFCYMIG